MFKKNGSVAKTKSRLRPEQDLVALTVADMQERVSNMRHDT